MKKSWYPQWKALEMKWALIHLCQMSFLNSQQISYVYGGVSDGAPCFSLVGFFRFLELLSDTLERTEQEDDVLDPLSTLMG